MATSKAEHMKMMHSMCQQEIEVLQQNLACFLRESARWRLSIGGGGGGKDGVADNPFVLIAFDGYMSHVSSVVGMARKFNIHLQLNRLDKILPGVGAVGSDKQEPCTFKDFMQWNSILQEQSAASADDFLSQLEQHEAIESASANCISSTSTKTTATTTLSVRKVRSETTPESNVAVVESPSSTSCSILRPLPGKDLSAFCEGYEFAASITYIEDFKRLFFYICQMNNNDLLDLSNMRHLQRYVAPPSPSADEIFGVSINNESIRRAVMQPSIDATPNALLIDFGEVVSLGNHCELFHVPLRYQRIPAQAIKCVLLGLNDAPNADDDDFPYLASVLERSEFKRVTFRVIRKVRAVLHVRLLENHPAEKLKVLLRSQKPAKAVVNPFLNSWDEDLTAFNAKDDDAAIPLSALKISENNNWKRKFELKLNVSADNDLVVDSPKDSLAPPVTMSHIKAAAVESTNEAISPPVDDDDSIVKLTVTHVAEVDCFYGQIETTANELRAPLFWHDDELPPQQKLLTTPHLNDLVLAQYINDEFWYRAQVKEINDEKQIFKVFFVDFGNTETVPPSCLAKCMLTQTEEPYRAIRCRLADVRDITGNDDIRRNQALQSLFVIILNQSFVVKILQRSEKELLIRIVDQEFANVPQILISMGYAKQI